MNKMAKKKTVVHLWIGQEGTACGKSHIGLDEKYIWKSVGDLRKVNCKKCLKTSEMETIKKMIGGFDACKALRKIAKQVPERETVLLPNAKPNQWWDGKDKTEQNFETVNVQKLLQFIADMIE